MADNERARVWKLNNCFDGKPKMSDFTLVDEEVCATLKSGEVLLEALYISVDPYTRIDGRLRRGEEVEGEQVARVKASNHPDLPVDSVVVASVGWRTLTAVDATQTGVFGPLVTRLPNLGQLPPSLALGCVGMTGLTAYYGLMERGQPRAGDVVLVNAAAGAVGAVVGQLAKLQSCIVIGSAGSKEKCDWLTELGFDHVFNYKEKTVDEALREIAPDGVDLFFDNVGGDYTDSVITNHMKPWGRVVMCGAISIYNQNNPCRRDWTLHVVEKNLTVMGINVVLYAQKNEDTIAQLLDLVRQGKLKYRETITKGFETVPSAFISLFNGANMGKTVVQVFQRKRYRCWCV